MRAYLPLLLCLSACQAAAGPEAPAPVGPTPGAIRFSSAAVGPVSLAGGAVVADPGVLCPGASVRVVGAGLPAGQVVLSLTPGGGPASGPLAIRADGSFDATVPLPSLAPGSRYEIGVALGEARAALPLAACTPGPTAPGLVLGAAGVVQ